MNFADTKILVVGSANVDFVLDVDHVPHPGESLMGRDFRTVCGGKGANQAVAAARLGAQVTFVGCVGNDDFAGQQRRSLGAESICLDHLKQVDDEATGIAMIIVDAKGQNTIVVAPGANLKLLPEDIDDLDGIMPTFDAVLLQLEIPLKTVEATVDLARKHNVLSVLDAGPAQAVPEALLAKADIVSPNETEAATLTAVGVCDEISARTAAERLRDMGVGEVVMKLGANGSLYCGDKTLHAAPFPVTPVDTVAAGDAFTAALGVSWRILGPEQALRFANAVGGLATTQSGAQPSMPTLDTVNKFLAEHEE